jgi:phospholipid/cholesterol/gamma-HCH transport system substrate-binding protein
MSKKGIETLVGLFVLLGLLGLVFLAMKAANLGNVGGGDTYALQARFDNIGGLKPRAPVRTAGVVVGRVKSITLDPKSFQGVVTMDIERGYQFPKDTAAKILTAGLLGDQYIGLEPGGDDKNLAAGETLTQTQSAVVLENLIGQFLTGKAADAGAGNGAHGAGGVATAPAPAPAAASEPKK